MPPLNERVMKAAEEAIAQKKQSCTLISDSFECNAATKIKMISILEESSVKCWFEDIGNDQIKIYLQWGKLAHEYLNDLEELGVAVENKNPEGGGSIRT